MKNLYICNTSSDSISIIDLKEFKEKKKILLKCGAYDRIGPHGIYVYDNKIFTANNYNNSISIIDINNNFNIENYFIGVHCNDIKLLNDKVYVACGDSNNLIVFNINTKTLLRSLPCGNLPHSIDINKKKYIMVISNVNNDSITLVDCIEDKIVKKINVGTYPTKALFSLNHNYIFVCESNIGLDCKGSLSIISLNNFKIITRVSLGYSPVDMCIDENYCFVSNFGEGTISIIDINNFKQVDLIKVGGMPRGILKFNNNLYVCDNYNSLLIKINIKTKNKNTISIGSEPTGMFLY